MIEFSPWYIVYLVCTVYLIYRVWIRLRLSRAKHPSLRGHAKWSRRIARLIPYLEYAEEKFFSCDNAPTDIVQQRHQALERLNQHFHHTTPEGIAFNHSLQDSVSDVLFTNHYRVPFPFRKYLSTRLTLPIAVQETQGVRIRDLDGNWSYDLAGSYGVNVFGYDFYKQIMQDGLEEVKQLGPVLGLYHPIVRDNVERLKKISGLDEVSFHMSGTEAVMQAVRLARYHTGKSHLVRFCGAYHGWWDGVQPGIGNQRTVDDVYTLQDMSDATLKVLNTRNDIACVLVNPLQALHPNADAASDASLINSERYAHFDRQAYTTWLQQLLGVCSSRGIVLILDEVFTGFRLAYRGAQEYFGIQADMVTYGKTLGGGLPVGVVCGRHHLMKRFRDDQPVNISFARGTFNSHPYVMACMHRFLRAIEKPEFQRNYQQADELWNRRASLVNQRLQQEGLPVRVANLMSIWTILYTQPSRYNWMFQFYLRANGLSLSWIGSGRMIFSHNYSEQDFLQVVEHFIDAARDMQRDEWWWQTPAMDNRAIKRQVLREMITAKIPLLNKRSHSHPELGRDAVSEAK